MNCRRNCVQLGNEEPSLDRPQAGTAVASLRVCAPSYDESLSMSILLQWPSRSDSSLRVPRARGRARGLGVGVGLGLGIDRRRDPLCAPLDRRYTPANVVRFLPKGLVTLVGFVVLLLAPSVARASVAVDLYTIGPGNYLY